MRVPVHGGLWEMTACWSPLPGGRRQSPYRDTLGLQDEAGHVPGRQADADGVLDALHQVGPEGVPRGHLQEEDHPLLPILVVLGDTEAVHHLLEGFHCGDRGRATLQLSRLGQPTLTRTAPSPPSPPGKSPWGWGQVEEGLKGVMCCPHFTN